MGRPFFVNFFLLLGIWNVPLNHDINHYRYIGLPSRIYKLLTKMITNRLQNELEECQPKKQVFRTVLELMIIWLLKFWCRNHWHITCQNILNPLNWNRTTEWIHYMLLINECTNARVVSRLTEELEHRNVTLSTKLFILSMEGILKELHDQKTAVTYMDTF